MTTVKCVLVETTVYSWKHFTLAPCLCCVTLVCDYCRLSKDTPTCWLWLVVEDTEIRRLDMLYCVTLATVPPSSQSLPFPIDQLCVCQDCCGKGDSCIWCHHWWLFYPLERLVKRCCTGSLKHSVPDSPIWKARLNGLHKYVPDGRWLKLKCHTVTGIDHRKEGFVDMTNEGNKTETVGQDFQEGSTVGTLMETLLHRFAAKEAVIETFRQ